MGKLILLPTALTTEDRIQNQIDAFRANIMRSNGDIQMCNQMIDIVIDYLAEFDDENIMLNQAYVKLQEASFWLDSSMQY